MKKGDIITGNFGFIWFLIDNPPARRPWRNDATACRAVIIQAPENYAEYIGRTVPHLNLDGLWKIG